MNEQRPSSTARPYFRTPALSPDGRQVAFVYAADIWLADTAGGEAQRLTAHPASHFSPRFSPDGTQIAFSSNRTGGGDIYVLPLDGGDVRRLTFHDTPAIVEDWSADGQYVYFSSRRGQQASAIYRVALAGDTPVEIVAEPFEDLMHVSISLDGSTLALNNARTPWSRRGPNPYGPVDIWLVPAVPSSSNDTSTTLVRKLNSYVGMNRWPLWAPDRSGIYFISDSDGSENVWYQPLESGELRQITHFSDGRVLWPTLARSANVLVFERDFDLWRLDLASSEAAPISLRVRADTRVTPVRVETHNRVNELALAPDGKKLAFVARGEVFADFADKETDKEQRQGPAFRVTNSPFREKEVVWTPDSRRLAYVSDRHGEDELYQYDFLAHTETRLTHDPAPKTAPCCSPDGKWIAFIRGNDEIQLLNTETREVRPFAQGSFIWSTALAWSPDSCWLAYLSHDDHLFTNVYVKHIDEQASHQVTFLSNLGGDELLWSPNGRFLIFTSSQNREELQVARVDLRPLTPNFREAEFEKLFEEKRTPNATPTEQPDTPSSKPTTEAAIGQTPQAEQIEEGKSPASPEDAPVLPLDDPPVAPAIAPEQPELERKEQRANANRVEIVFEGIERRLRLLTPIQMDAKGQTISPDSRDLLVTATVADKINIWSLPLDEPRQDQPPRQLTYSTSHKGAVQFAPDGKSFYYVEDGQIIVRKFPNGNDPQTIQVRADVVVDFNQEKRQMFGETWRVMRDSFYDASFRGQDWNAVRERYAPVVDGARTASDLHQILNLMLGELRASHLAVGFFGRGGSQDGYTGLLFDPIEQCERGGLRIATVVPDSPATRAVDASGSGGPPKVGEYLLAVDGVPLGPQVSLDMLLQRSVGRRVQLRLSDSTEAEHTHEVAIRPVDATHYAQLRYRAWVAANEAYVHHISDGRLGYVHIEHMSYPAYQQFLADLDTEAHGKEGVVVDVRYNSGGHTATFILDVLARPSVLLSAFRGRSSSDAGHLAGNRVLGKPTVLVTNEHSGSNTEMLSESYRRLGLGLIVGKPTAGAVIWTWGMRMLDGATLRLPRMSINTPEGEDLEGTGRPVDVDVEQPLGEWARGIDRQLDAAVATLLGRMRARNGGQ